MLGNLQKVTMKRSKLKAKYYKMNTPEKIKPFLSDKGKSETIIALAINEKKGNLIQSATKMQQRY